ncbi:MSP (Major sperm protein) domain-containing protein [Ditylenchus destructor]|nr:MSP (Major sperm protein) domain-containing protein [Ditylenchus destructor]
MAPFPVITKLNSDSNPPACPFEEFAHAATARRGTLVGKTETAPMPPPDRAPPKPPSYLPLPLVPQTPAAFTFSIEPARAAFTTEGGISKHMMMNHSSDRLAIKVRCSNNRFFRVNPVFSFLDCGCMNELEMIRLQGGVPRRDMLSVIYVLCRDNDNDPSLLFTNRAKTRSIIVPITTI